MNKDDAVKLAEDVGYTENEMSSDGEWNICMTEDALLAFANACEKIGMEKAAKICEPLNMDNPNDWTENARIKAECAEEIRNHYEPSMADFRCTEPD